MIVFSCEGMRSIDERDVIACYSEQPTRRWCDVTVILVDGREISGRAATQAVRALEALLNELPPAA
jgi:hypothetical protein